MPSKSKKTDDECQDYTNSVFEVYLTADTWLLENPIQGWEWGGFAMEEIWNFNCRHVQLEKDFCLFQLTTYSATNSVIYLLPIWLTFENLQPLNHLSSFYTSILKKNPKIPYTMQTAKIKKRFWQTFRISWT